MPSPSTVAAFATATLVLLVIPGPAVMYIVTRSAAQGRTAGIVSVAGIHLGTLVHVVAAMIGLSALVATSAAAFSVVKLAGAGYLVWLGVRSIRASFRRPTLHVPTVVTERSLRRVFVDGVVVNVLNPKTAIFFLSFVPQFVAPDAAHPTVTIAVLGGIFIALGFLSDGAYALAGGWIGGRLQRSARVERTKDLVAGGTYLGLGVLAATSGPART